MTETRDEKSSCKVRGEILKRREPHSGRKRDKTPNPCIAVLHCSVTRLLCTESAILFNHLIICRPLLLLPSIFPSIRVLTNEPALCIKRSKNWSFGFSICSSKEYSGLISFRIDWCDLLAVQGTPKGLLQHHSSKALILQSSAFFIIQLSHPDMTTGKKRSFDQIDLCRQSNVSAF